jgi:hypothetical protein
MKGALRFADMPRPITLRSSALSRTGRRSNRILPIERQYLNLMASQNSK